MSAEEKILQSITEDAREQAEKIVKEAEEKVAEITETAKANAREYSAKSVSAALLKAQNIKKNAESGAELVIRDARLSKKHEEIAKTLAMATEKIKNLPDEEYFELLSRLALSGGADKGGILMLSKNDSKRNLSVFEAKLQEKGLNLQTTGSAANIENGFILKHGDVEYNFSLDAIITDKKSVLEDRIHKVLFAD